MRLLDRLRRKPADLRPLPPLDLDALLHQVRTDPGRYRLVESRLRERRAALVQRQKALERSSGRPSPPQLRNAGRLGPIMGSLDFQQQIQNASSGSGFDVDLEAQIHQIDETLADVRAILRGDA